MMTSFQYSLMSRWHHNHDVTRNWLHGEGACLSLPSSLELTVVSYRRGVVCSLWFQFGAGAMFVFLALLSTLYPKRQTIGFCDGHEDLSSFWAVSEAIKFDEKPICVEIELWKWVFWERFQKKTVDFLWTHDWSLYPSLRMRARGKMVTGGEVGVVLN